jgi:hypothetical protein
VLSNLFYGEICCTKLDKTVILLYFPYNPKAKLRIEVLFKKFNPRINWTTLFSTKLYLLDTIKTFLGHENRSLTKSQKPLQGGTIRNLNFKILSILFCFWTPRNKTKIPLDLFWDEIRLTKFPFSHSESEFIWKVPLRLKVL